MTNLNATGLSKEKSSEISGMLNNLLSDYQIYYQNLRGLHWLVRGRQFFQLHAKYEELYNEAAETIDEIAERILMLGNVPFHSFEEYLQNASIKPVKNVSDGNRGVEIVVEETTILLTKVREILEKASDSNDEGTASFMSGLISGFEKNLWMFDSFLNK